MAVVSHRRRAVSIKIKFQLKIPKTFKSPCTQWCQVLHAPKGLIYIYMYIYRILSFKPSKKNNAWTENVKNELIKKKTDAFLDWGQVCGCGGSSLNDTAMTFGLFLDHNVFDLTFTGGDGGDDSVLYFDGTCCRSGWNSNWRRRRRWRALRIRLVARTVSGSVDLAAIGRISAKQRRTGRVFVFRRTVNVVSGRGRVASVWQNVDCRLPALQHLGNGPAAAFQQFQQFVSFSAQISIRSKWVVNSRFRAIQNKQTFSLIAISFQVSQVICSSRRTWWMNINCTPRVSTKAQLDSHQRIWIMSSFKIEWGPFAFRYSLSVLFRIVIIKFNVVAASFFNLTVVSSNPPSRLLSIFFFAPWRSED